ncbi:hypothetical protein KU74_01880 [Pectobacterium brasiliense]|uniref:Uncharacterized protein n=2 Tax=Pectobacterium brasiliense TaxID=180957 RepID=A0A0M2F5K1_9GAMM|nr:hypothetical protein KU74_01880 [Pectobacterium brasiliense]
MTKYLAVKGQSNMASKHKITTYFSNTTTYDWVTNAAAEQGVTKSGYLEGLIRQEMERNQEKTIIKPRVMIYEPYKIQERQLVLSSQCEINIIPFISIKENEKHYNKELNRKIDTGIYNDFNYEVINRNMSLPSVNHFVILLKTELEGRVFIREGNLFNIIYSVNYQPIVITENLWKKYDGYYDFFNAIYLRQTDLISRHWQRTIANKYAGVVPIDDKKIFGKDKGCFFIPVLRKPHTWQEIVKNTEGQGGILPSRNVIKGVTTLFNKERFNLKGRELFKEPYKLS